MTRTTWLLALLLLGASTAALIGWRKVAQLRSENDSLQTQLQALQEQSATSSATATAQRDRELENLRSQTSELLRLRSEVNQLRTSAKDADKLRADNQQLLSENQRLRTGTASAAASNPSPAKDQFARDNWTFSGYATPDAALISAIWAMKEGNPRTYLESLSPEEQARMSKVWENKSEAEIAAKHQSDVAAISGMQILDRKTISPDEVQMNVYIQGVDRLEKVSMKQIEGQWKFGGFIRDPKK